MRDGCQKGGGRYRGGSGCTVLNLQAAKGAGGELPVGWQGAWALQARPRLWAGNWGGDSWCCCLTGGEHDLPPAKTFRHCHRQFAVETLAEADEAGWWEGQLRCDGHGDEGSQQLQVMLGKPIWCRGWDGDRGRPGSSSPALCNERLPVGCSGGRAASHSMLVVLLGGAAAQTGWRALAEAHVHP